MMKKSILALAVAAIAMTSCNKTPQLSADNIDDVIAAMTLEEKAHLIVGTGMAGFSGDSAVVGATKSIVPGAAGTTYPIPRLGIPAIVLADGPAGLRIDPIREGDSATYYCTHFPIGTLLASTWDTELVEAVGKAMGNEVLEYGADVLLAPALNIHRNPLCGRNFEYYSEDPLVAGAIAAAYVNGVQSNGVGTSVKHFAANNQESNRMHNDAQVSERAMREIYLRGFEKVIKEAQPWTVMSSYNYINGTYTSESEDLLTTVLRDEWGYPYVVMTDWFGGKDAVAQVTAGNDMLQPGTDKQYQAIIDGVNSGLLDEALVDRNVKRILELVVKSPKFKGYKYSNQPDLKAHAEVTRQSATEGMVLLKNDKQTLPLAADKKNVALLGCTSYDFIAGGTGSGNVNRAYTVDMVEGLGNVGLTIDPSVKDAIVEHMAAEDLRNAPDPNDALARFLPKKRPAEWVPSDAAMKQLVANNDLAIITIGRTSGEFLDRTPDDFNIKPEERQLIEKTTKAFHAAGKPVIVVLNIGGVVETASWKNLPDAILCAWQGGQEGGNSVADVLMGNANPSGKLPMTFPNAFADHASSANFPIEGATSSFGFDQDSETNIKLWDYTPYEEDIYVGYRYFDSFDKNVSYPFGYGLSYTTFDYSYPQISEENGVYTVTVDVTNTGNVAGKEVVQLYAVAPNAVDANKPAHELKAFGKTKALAPGEKQTVTLTFAADDLASYDEAQSAWVVDAGEYTFQVGASSRDIKGEVKANVEGKTIPAHKVLTPQVELNTLARK